MLCIGGTLRLLLHLARGADWLAEKLLAPRAGNVGRFEGEVLAEWSEDGRDMRLLEDFSYIDPEGKRWLARKGSLIDGASIPRAFWTLIGGPFAGRYRAASVIHDVACVQRSEPWEAVHRMFYHAMLCGGVQPRKARMMYFAVREFGPRWILHGTKLLRRPKSLEATSDEVAAVAEYFARFSPSVELIEGLSMKRILQSLA